MVVEVYGKTNGIHIVFSRQVGDRWETQVPWTDDGEYIVEMYAKDDAGNVGYVCTMLFAITGHELQGYIVPRGFTGMGNSDDYKGLPRLEEFLGNVQNTFFSGMGTEKEYMAELQEGGYAIERSICSRNEH